MCDEIRFGDALTTRINNTMLVSALLITVTTALMLYPPQYALPDGFGGDANSNPNTRAFFYIASICNLTFIASIILGVAFVESGMMISFVLFCSMN